MSGSNGISPAPATFREEAALAQWPGWLLRLRLRLNLHRQAAALVAYCGASTLAYALAYLLRFEFRVPADYLALGLATTPALLLVRAACVRLFRLSRGRWRFVGPRDLQRLVEAVAAGTIVFGVVSQLPFWGLRVPLSVVFLEALLTTTLTAGMWVSYRLLFERLSFRRRQRSGRARRVLVVGAGEAGYILAQEMWRGHGYEPVGFVDDNPLKWGTRIDGLEVIGASRDLEAIAATERAEEIVIAIPTLAPGDLRRLVSRCEATGLPFRVLPGIREVMNGRIELSQLRRVRIEDLLGREPVELKLPELAAELGGRSVLITGAAGSIGSELARQVALHGPRTLVLLDQSETSLFYLEMELRERHPALDVVAVIGSVVDSASVDRVFRQFAPERVFHAAAYKHVPMMQSNAREAVRNNVIGTWRVAEAAGRYGAAKFVLVSTDKAVRPVSVMGATKRLAEMVVLELQQAFPDTAYAAVRFGNVLGSNGSVIPIFKRQIEEGKPLTVTHPDATRYFMTIPEAVQLILQASLLPELRGHVAMLEMGDQVRIVDLARNLLHLSGISASAEGRIVFTGLRPGERLHEELVAPDEVTVPTAIEKVRLVLTSTGGGAQLLEQVADWTWRLELGEDRTVLSTVEGYFSGLIRPREGRPDARPAEVHRRDHEPGAPLRAV